MNANNRPYDWANPPEPLGENWTQPEDTGFWQSLSPSEKRIFKIVGIVFVVILMPLDLYWAISSPPPDGIPNESVTVTVLFFVACYFALKLLRKTGLFVYERAFSEQQQLKLKSFQRRLLYWLGF